MPILTADMSAGTLVAWRKKPGDAITRGDVIALVETDKGLIDIEAFTTGVLEKILVQPGTTVPTGTVLAIIEDGASAEARAPFLRRRRLRRRSRSSRQACRPRPGESGSHR